MLLKLMNRDFVLHRDVLLIPLLWTFAMGGLALGRTNAMEGFAAVGIILGFLFVGFIPLTLHVRELSQGTFADVLALPVSRAELVTHRYLQVMLLSAIEALLVIGGLLLHRTFGAGSRAVAVSFNPSDWLPLGILLLVAFAYPMPFAFRWGGKGILIAYGLLWLLGILAWNTPHHAGVLRLFKSLEHLARPGWRAPLYLLGLFLGSYGCSIWALRKLDG